MAMPRTGRRLRPAPNSSSSIRAFSSEVGTGSREENASKQKTRVPFRFHRNGTLVAVGPAANPVARWRTVGGARLCRWQDAWRSNPPRGPMRTILAQVFAAFIAAAGPAHAAVGFQHFGITDPQGPPIEVGVWYPTGAAPKLEAIESNQQMVALDAAVEGAGLPLVVISHGHGGSYAGHLDTATALANAGFIVAALSHHGDSWRDPGNPTAVWERPRQLKLLIDYMLGAWGDHSRIDANRVGAFGFSAGGFTVLVAAGGEPDLATITDHCKAHPAFEVCQIVGEHPSLPLETDIVWTHDLRIKAVVSA